MKSNVQTVLAIFANKRRYIVPMFQRQYVWSLDRQWLPLWEDVERRVIDRMRWNEKLKKAHPEELIELKAHPPAEHFLGAIVLDLHPTFGDEVSALLVIDGQQRLTTCQVFLASLRDVARARGFVEIADELVEHLKNKGIMQDAQVEKYKVWSTQFDQPAFKAIIDSGSLSLVVDQFPRTNKPRIVGAYEFFTQRVERFLDAEVVSDRLESQPNAAGRVKGLFEVFQHDLQIVSIQLEGQDDPQVIFETLNARGENLLPSDLLRNYLFWKASRETPDQVQTLYDTYWKHFDSEFWKKEEKQGRLTRPRVDLFFFNMLQLKTGAEVNVARLYHEYKVWTENPPRYATVADELREIHRYSLELGKLFRPSDDTDIGRFVQMLNIFDVKTVNSLLLGILAEGGLSDEDLRGILDDLESYLVRRAVCGLTAAAYNRTFVSWMAKLLKEGISRAGLQGIMLKEDAESALWPDDARFFQAWLNKELYARLYTRGRMEYILKRLELALRTTKNEDVPVNGKLTVEHVLPQAWIEYWPLANGNTGLTRDQRLLTPSPESERRDHMLQTMGNLTLLTGPANSENRNLPFTDKLQKIEEYSLLVLNKYFGKRSARGLGWDEDAIEERGRVLFERAKIIWPHPGVAA
jgi:uncharacterized protein with ParB-like and HNH nuclease domain